MQISVPSAEAVLDALRTEVVLLDGRGRIVACNAAWRRFGLQNDAPATDWRGVDYLSVSQGPDGGDAARLGILEVLEGRRDRFELEYPCHSPTQERWFEMVATRLGDLVVVEHDDVTAQHLAQRFRQRLWEHGQALKEEAQRRAFAATFLEAAAGRLRAPWHSLHQRLLEAQGDLGPRWAPIAAALERLEDAAARVERTSLALTKPMQPATFPLTFLRDVLDEHRPEAARRDLRLTTGLLDLEVTADPDLLQECVACLVSAAVAACPSGGAVHLGSRPEGDSVEVRVEADAGRGDEDVELWLQAARQLSRQGGLGLREAAGARTLTLPSARPVRI